VGVEDHRLDYLYLQGYIPAGHSGAGSVMLWDQGRYERIGSEGAAEQLARGDLKLRRTGERLRGQFALVRINSRRRGAAVAAGKHGLLIKKQHSAARPGWDLELLAWSVPSRPTQEEIAQNGPPYPEAPQVLSLQPMLAATAAEPPNFPLLARSARFPAN